MAAPNGACFLPSGHLLQMVGSSGARKCIPCSEFPNSGGIQKVGFLPKMLNTYANKGQNAIAEKYCMHDIHKFTRKRLITKPLHLHCLIQALLFLLLSFCSSPDFRLSQK
jgi:hypothetical protein